MDIILKVEEIKKGLNDVSKDFIDDLYIDEEFITNFKNDDSYVEDLFQTYADEAVDVYYSDLLKWLNSEYHATDYIDKAMEDDIEYNDFFELLRAGQYLYKIDKLEEDAEEIKQCVKLIINNEEDEV